VGRSSGDKRLMTIIYFGTNFHIEYHVGTIQNVANLGFYGFVVNFDKPGRFLGGSVFVNALGGDFIISGPFLSKAAPTATPLFGDALSALTISCANTGDIKDIQGACLLYIQD